MFKFNQRDLVQDKITGFKGIVVGRTEWSNGCIRYSVASKELKDGKPIDHVGFDEQDIELVEAAIAEPVTEARKGGPKPEPSQRSKPGRR